MLSFLVFYIIMSLDLSIWIGVAVGETILWINAWFISRRKKKWPHKVETGQQQKKQELIFGLKFNSSTNPTFSDQQTHGTSEER
jgi:hypothetical protein